MQSSRAGALHVRQLASCDVSTKCYSAVFLCILRAQLRCKGAEENMAQGGKKGSPSSVHQGIVGNEEAKKKWGLQMVEH